MAPPILAPPRAESESARSDLPDPEALMKEARRRARRRRAGYLLVAVTAVGLALGAFFGRGGGGGGETGRDANANRPAGAVPQAGEVETTLPVSLTSTVLFAARGDSLFVAEVPGASKTLVVMRANADGFVQRRSLSFPLSAFLADISVGPEGVYAGTSVIRRFAQRPDELVRIDAGTLAVRARASFPAGIATIAHDQRLWAAIGDGRVVRLDPRTLLVRAARRVLPAAATAGGAAILLKPAFGLGSVWVLAGNALNLELIRLDPTNLAVRSETRVPTGGALAQALNRVSAGAGGVSLVGDALARVASNGKLIGHPVLVPGLATAAPYGDGFVGLAADPPALLLLDRHGRLRARTRVADASAELAVSGRNVWFLGAAGHGNGIVHVRIARS